MTTRQKKNMRHDWAMSENLVDDYKNLIPFSDSGFPTYLLKITDRITSAGDIYITPDTISTSGLVTIKQNASYVIVPDSEAVEQISFHSATGNSLGVWLVGWVVNTNGSPTPKWMYNLLDSASRSVSFTYTQYYYGFITVIENTD